jgi:hypothetical protein
LVGKPTLMAARSNTGKPESRNELRAALSKIGQL